MRCVNGNNLIPHGYLLYSTSYLGVCFCQFHSAFRSHIKPFTSPSSSLSPCVENTQAGLSLLTVALWLTWLDQPKLIALIMQKLIESSWCCLITVPSVSRGLYSNKYCVSLGVSGSLSINLAATLYPVSAGSAQRPLSQKFWHKSWAMCSYWQGHPQKVTHSIIKWASYSSCAWALQYSNSAAEIDVQCQRKRLFDKKVMKIFKA